MCCLTFEGLGTVFLHGKAGVRSRRGFYPSSYDNVGINNCVGRMSLNYPRYNFLTLMEEFYL
jgi:hypothetical protein